ncbi:MAG: transaldolase [Gemmatimonadota bacterium]|jgi:transaldolase|nr:transaldolase [Gemmatimonadota bacterium]
MTSIGNREISPLDQLLVEGQSVWLDYIRRGMLRDGGMERLIRERGLRGVTSNPAIFEQAIGRSDDYDAGLAVLAASGADAMTAYEILAIEDIRAAADFFRGVYEESKGEDGYVSLEVSPELARDGEGTLEEARRLWAAVDRPNVMIKIPGTEEGLPAIETAIAEGINVNVTLLFSLSGYEAVMEAYLRGLERRAAAGLPLGGIASVASFFISRVDTAVDGLLERFAQAAGDEDRRTQLLGLRGRAAIANAKMAYRRFREVFGDERFNLLMGRGARPQRPLWASTSTKNPEYRDVIYVEELIGPDTVNTMPLATVEAFADHGVVARTVDADLPGAERELAALAEAGINLDEVTERLQVEGVEKFVDPFRDLLRTIEGKMAQVAGR